MKIADAHYAVISMFANPDDIRLTFRTPLDLGYLKSQQRLLPKDALARSAFWFNFPEVAGFCLDD